MVFSFQFSVFTRSMYFCLLLISAVVIQIFKRLSSKEESIPVQWWISPKCNTQYLVLAFLILVQQRLRFEKRRRESDDLFLFAFAFNFSYDCVRAIETDDTYCTHQVVVKLRFFFLLTREFEESQSNESNISKTNGNFLVVRQPKKGEGKRWLNHTEKTTYLTNSNLIV